MANSETGVLIIRNSASMLFTRPDDLNCKINKFLSKQQTEHTKDNQTSSRTHSLNLLVIKYDGLKSVLKVVDLAGKESVVETNTNNISNTINKNIMELERLTRNAEKIGSIWRGEGGLIKNIKDIFVPVSGVVCKTRFYLCVSHNNLKRTEQTLDFGISICSLNTEVVPQVIFKKKIYFILFF